MPAPTLSEAQSLPDALLGDHYVINFGTIPGGGDTYRLVLTCTSVPIPGTSIEPVEQAFPGGHTRKFPGKRVWQRTFSAEFTEHVDTQGLQMFRNWLEQCRGTESGKSAGYMDDISVTAEVQIYDTTGQLADHTRIYRCWPQELQDITMSADGSQIVKINATMSFDYTEYSNVTLR